MKILVLGSKGQLGKCLNSQLENTNHDVLYTSREQIDISDFELTRKKILKASPNIIINATAYTAVDKAEEHQETADLINHLAIKNIANICNQQDYWLIHISTDYVFDGNSKVPYKENDQTNPKSVYGHTKLKGELAIQLSGCKHIIIRTAWVFSEYGNNFLKTMLLLGATRDKLSIVGDQLGCPTYGKDIASSIIAIIPHLNSNKNIQGIYHYCGDEPCTWHDFAQEIFNEAKLLGNRVPDSVNSINTNDYPTPAARPAYSVLNTSKIKSFFLVNNSDWRIGVKVAVKNVIKNSS
mgnify:CR=1 FL=1|jgi:dTDP-4-dehydrorhamnose reductase